MQEAAQNSRQKWGRRRQSCESLKAALVQLLLAVGVSHRILTACGLGMRVALLTLWCITISHKWEKEKSCGVFSPQQTTLPLLGEDSNSAGHLSQTRVQLKETVTKLPGQDMRWDIWCLLALLPYTVFSLWRTKKWICTIELCVEVLALYLL